MKQERVDHNNAERPLPSVFLACPSLLFVAGFLLYAQTLSSSFHWDDWKVIVENPTLRHPTNLKALFNAFNTRFVAGLTLAFNYALGGLNVFGYHLFNVVIHLTCSCLVYTLVLTLLKTPAMKQTSFTRHSPLLALACALIFLVHPIQTQAVNYVWQRVASLASLFYLSSLILYLQARLYNRWQRYLGSLILALLGLFTKEITVTLPVMMGVCELLFFDATQHKGKKRFLWIAPFLFLTAVIPFTLTRSGKITLFIMKSPSLTAPSAAGKNFPEVLASMTRWLPEETVSRKDYCLTQLNVLRTYLRLLFVPIRQNLDYDYPITQHLTEPATLFSLVLLLLVFAIGLLFARRQPLLAFGIFWFFVTVSPESLVVLPDVLFEHRLYLPMIGFALFVPAALWVFFQDRRRFILTMSVTVLLLSRATTRRNQVWRDELTLWQDVVKKSPGKWRGYNMVASAYADVGNYDMAIPYFQKAIERLPNSAELYGNLGAAYGASGEDEKVVAYCQKALTLDPAYQFAYATLGTSYARRRRYLQAIEYYEKAIALDPSYLEANNDLGAAYALSGNREGVLRQIEKLKSLNRPDLADELKKLLDD